MKERTLSDRIFLFLKGIAMGSVNKVPGVSGGIVALIGGFYEEMIYTFQRFNFKALSLLLNGRWRSFYQYINLAFLLWLLAGIVVSYFTTAIALDYFMMQSERNVWACFFGMIIASVYYIKIQIRQWHPSTYGTLLAGLLFGIIVSFSDPIPENDHWMYVFFCGIVSVCGMTLPGLSGSYLLILLGNYSLLLVDTVNDVYTIGKELLRGHTTILQETAYQQSLIIIMVFVLGSVVGLVLFSNVLAYLLRYYKNQTLSGIIGFIIGATRSVWPWKDKIYQKDAAGHVLFSASGKQKIEAFKTFWPSWEDSTTWVTVACIVLGAGIVIALEWYGKTQTQQS